MAETQAANAGAPLDLTPLCLTPQDRVDTARERRRAAEPRFGEKRAAEPLIIDAVATESQVGAVPTAGGGVILDETPALVLGADTALSSTSAPIGPAPQLLDHGASAVGPRRPRRPSAPRRGTAPIPRRGRGENPHSIDLGVGSPLGQALSPVLDALSNRVLRPFGRGLSMLRRDAKWRVEGDAFAAGCERVTEADTPMERNWAEAHAPSAAAFEALGSEAFARLPEPFRASCAGVAILVREWPDEDMLRMLDLESPYDLLGLYDGVDLTQASGFDAPTDLNRIYLFRRPLLDYWAEHEESLGHLITHVLVHEIGHHLGLSDADMDAIEAAAR